MAMPLIPSLLNSSDPGDGGGSDEEAPPLPGAGLEDLVAWLDSLDDDQVGQLVAAAQEGATPTEDDPNAAPETGDEEQPAEGVDTPDDEDAETADDELAESPDEQDQEQVAGVEDLSTITDTVASDIEEGQGIVKALEKLAGDKESEHAADAKKLAKQAQGLLDQMTRCQKAALKAAKSEDPHECAQAGVDARGLLEAIESLHAAAAAMGSKTTIAEPTLKDHPSMKAWSQRILSKAAPPLG